ncbi:tetratricopeptide repeat-containing protein [Alsobacter soli]|uniref:Tetratricopeptide repeat protein 38 n=1 Tax=Alsobacter soli TaxID=2109933 RepID=A0A2T1HWU9_9HYPH|nr:tetratricopeptide repeat protein [Alsobacter soli]PSC06058.1 tetratricopeptide repeat-containing protein [Alsobacter soli]
MMIDHYGGRHTTESQPAVAAFEEAVGCLALHRPGVPEAIAKALAADPGLVAGHALRGLASVILARAECVDAARQDHARAVTLLGIGKQASDDERALVSALGKALQGCLLAAADALDSVVAERPTAFLLLKLSHALRFMAGDLGGMLATTRRSLPAWVDGRPGAGFVYGCHAFGLEEAGALDEAERFGVRAAALEPGDAWALHAVAHVHETRMRIDEGAAWLERSRPHWADCNNFRFHLSWHLALFELERGRAERVLALYDADVRPTPTDDFRDVANAASLLWRLAQEGVPVGDRWSELASIARRRTQDVTLVFASLHHLLSLVGAGARTEALALAESLRAAQGDQADVVRQVGADVARVILDLGGDGVIARAAQRLPLLGGSHAQRDVFLRTLALAAADRGDRAGYEAVLACRSGLRREDRFASLAAERLARAEAALQRRVA